MASHFHARAIGHHQVGDDQVVRVSAAELLARRVNTVYHVDAIALAPQQDLQHLAQTGFVVTDKNACGHDP